MPEPGEDHGSFDSWAQANWSTLLAIARVVAGDPYLADDVLQDVLVDLYSRWDRISGFDNLLGYATRVIGSKVANVRRSAWSRRVRTIDDLSLLDRSEADAIMATDDYLEVVAALQSLNARQRQIVALHYLLDMPVADISATLGRPVGSVTSDLTRARKILRDGAGGGDMR